MYNTHNYQFVLGQMVQMKDELTVGAWYDSKDGSSSEVVTASMQSFEGRKVSITARKDGKYMVSGDRYNWYTDGMFEEQTDDERFAKADYVYDAHVEAILQHAMDQQYEVAIDQALEARLHVNDPEAFSKLVNRTL